MRTPSADRAGEPHRMEGGDLTGSEHDQLHDHGHFVLVVFPSDAPAGPSTTLYVGRVQFTLNNLTGVFTLEDTCGTAGDLCAALSG